ncbi:hypothetical protein B0H13DRAFT_2359156 [Mycena leptocephala]|nr:hypothetical protein B0H13DRAFT_2359156 [Mycena leptocephala]
MTGTTPARVRCRLLLNLDANFLSFPQTINLPSRRTPRPCASSRAWTIRGFCLRSSLPLPPPFPSSCLPPQVQVCVNANDAFVGQIARPEERTRIVDAICARGGEMMMHQCISILSASSLRYVDHPPRYADWRVHAICHLPLLSLPVRILMISLHNGRIVDLATNCYGYYVIQKALECKEEEDCLLIVSELLRGDPARRWWQACVARVE